MITAQQEFEQERATRLQIHLLNIQDNARFYRYLDGGILIATGTILSTILILSTSVSSSIPDNSKTRLNITFGICGGFVIGMGILILCIPTAYEKLPQDYGLMPEDTFEDLRSKSDKGEAYLKKLSDSAQFGRYLSASLQIAIGGAEIILYGLDAQSIFAADAESLNNYLLLTGILNCGLGLLTFLIESLPENEYASYIKWRKGNINSSSNRSNLSVNISTITSLSSLKLRVSF